MATRIYGINKGGRRVDITEGVGSATVSKNIELTVDFGASPALSKHDVLKALEELKEYITNHKWLPA